MIASRFLSLLLASFIAVLVACTITPANQPAAKATEAPSALTAAAPVPAIQAGPDLGNGPPNINSLSIPGAGACHMRPNNLPDPNCTPGRANPTLTADAICAAGFTTKPIREKYAPVAYTDALKRRQMVAYGMVGINPSTNKAWSVADVEEDHLVALEDGGHPWAPENLWPQPRKIAGAEPNAEEKDKIETTVKKAICANKSAMATYQAQLAYDWTQLSKSGALPPDALTAAEPTKEPEP